MSMSMILLCMIGILPSNYAHGYSTTEVLLVGKEASFNQNISKYMLILESNIEIETIKQIMSKEAHLD